MESGKQAGKRVSFNQKSDVRRQKSDVRSPTSDSCAFDDDPNSGERMRLGADFGFQPK
jgi:hypothetical protein